MKEVEHDYKDIADNYFKNKDLNKTDHPLITEDTFADKHTLAPTKTPSIEDYQF